MKKSSIALAASVLMGLAGCGGGGDEPSLTGEWSLTLHPPGQATTHAEAITVDHVVFSEANGVVSGRSEGFTFQGIRRGQVLDLNVFDLDANGQAVSHGTLSLSLQGNHTVRGVGSTPQPQEPMLGEVSKDEGIGITANLEYDVTGELTNPMSAAEANAVIHRTNLNGTASSVLHTVCSIFSAASSFTMGVLTGNLFRPMGGCMLAKSGGGYYVFGRDAPGSIVPVWTQNVYVPVEWATCTARRYKFKFSYNGQGLLTSGVELLAHSKRAGVDLPGLSMLKVAGKDLADLAVELDNLRAKYGNYALLVATHPRTKFVGLYVIREKGNSDDFKKEAVIQTVAGHLKASVMVGKDLTDTFSLRRSPAPNLCLDQVEFAYLVGTADVTLD